MSPCRQRQVFGALFALTFACFALPAYAAGNGFALDVRSLHAKRTPSGYTLTGEALVRDPCEGARFATVREGSSPVTFAVQEFRPAKNADRLCIQRIIWIELAPYAVKRAYPPRWITVRALAKSYRVRIH